MMTPHRLLKKQWRQARAELILDEAEKLLAEKGYHDTSIDEIAARAGVAKGTLYQHFPSKEALILALLERNVELLEQTIERITREPGSARSRLEQLLHYVYQERPGQHRPLLQLVDQNAEIRQAIITGKQGSIYERWQQITHQIRRMLEDGKAEGEFDPVISTELMLCLFIDMLTLSGRQQLTATLSAEELFAQVKRVFFEGIVSRKLEK
ncbi:MAG TPA: helix-turn-helix domain-containing protein [Ktedonobacteraceae bacterium]|nr:helix-turn-helix domain-containing protein [Ktedonobacteraceae bacterium]